MGCDVLPATVRYSFVTKRRPVFPKTPIIIYFHPPSVSRNGSTAIAYVNDMKNVSSSLSGGGGPVAPVKHHHQGGDRGTVEQSHHPHHNPQQQQPPNNHGQGFIMRGV